MDSIIQTISSGGQELSTEERSSLAGALNRLLPDIRTVPESIRPAPGGLLALADQGEEQRYLALCLDDARPDWISLFSGTELLKDRLLIRLGAVCFENVPALWAALPDTRPVPLGLTPSFGFGDRLGLATPGHVLAMLGQGAGMAPIFCQQSIREMERTGRTPEDVMSDAMAGALRSGWRGPMGADADHLKNPADVDITARAGFVFFTIDPSEHVDQQAGSYDRDLLDQTFDQLLSDNVPGADELESLYLDRIYHLQGEGTDVTFDAETLRRAAVKYGRALAHIKIMAEHIGSVMQGEGFELEISVDETDEPTSVAEHLFIALELRRRSVPFVSLAPRFIGDFEKGVDYRGDLEAFRRSLKLHAAIAREYGPYKISLHSGSDKFSVYPLLAEACNGMFHVKTAGTSYLEALRAVARVDFDLFRDIVVFSRERFETDRATYHISATLDAVPSPGQCRDEELERLYLDMDPGRQILHVTFGSVLSTGDGRGRTLFKDRVMTLLNTNKRIHMEVLADHLGRHLGLLQG